MRILLIVLAFFVIGILAGLLSDWGSSPDKQSQPNLIGHRIALEQWPSDSMIRSLDSVPARQWINEMGNPSFRDTDNSVSQVIGGHSSSNSPSSGASLSSSARKDTMITEASKPKVDKNQGSESWLIAFSAGIKALSEGNGSSQIVEVAAGEDQIEQVLLRVYGSKSTKIPHVLIAFGLQKFNPNIDFEHLKSGQKIKLPKI